LISYLVLVSGSVYLFTSSICNGAWHFHFGADLSVVSSRSVYVF